MTTDKKTSTIKYIGKAVSYLAVIIICWMVFSKEWKCNDTPEKKEAKKIIKEQDKGVRTDSIASAHIQDSVNKIITYWKGQSTHWENNWKREVLENRELQDTLGVWLSETVPDTCEQYKQRAIFQYNKLVASSKIKDTSCSRALQANKKIISEKDVLIDNGKKDYSKLKLRYDTISSLAKQLLPKSEFGIGATVISSYLNIKPQVGVNLYFRTPKGLQIEFGYYTNNYVSAGIKKPLYRFK